VRCVFDCDGVPDSCIECDFVYLSGFDHHHFI
jgi:hypothetical protein